MVEIHRHKYFLMAKAATNSLQRRPPFLCVFVKHITGLRTETSPVIGFSCLQFGGDRNERNFFTDFSIIGPHGPLLTRAVKNQLK